MQEEKVCAGRGDFGLKSAHYAGKDGMCSKNRGCFTQVSPKYPRSIPEVSRKEVEVEVEVEGEVEVEVKGEVEVKVEVKARMLEG